MATDLSRREYPALLDNLHPTQAVILLNDRLKHVGKVNTEIADWLQERRRIEELYAAGLRKLAQREPPDSSSELGIFTTSWQKVVGSAASLAESHQTLAQKIESDIERPLRSFTTTNREMQLMPNMQGNLQSLARDYDAAQKKSDKLKGKNAANKVTTASSEMESASSQWSTQAPYVFEALQAVDESRCNHLRDILTQFQTHEVDLVEKSRKTAESTLNSVLNVETADEIKTFSTRNAEGLPADTRRRSDRRQSRSQGSGTLIPPVASPPPEDRASQRSASVHEEKKSRLGGLKRLGTVMRRKSTAPPSNTQRAPATKSPTPNLDTTTTSNGDQPPVTRETTTTSLQDWQLPSPGFAMPSAPVEEPQHINTPTPIAAPQSSERSAPIVEDPPPEPNAANGSSYHNEISQLQDPPALPSPPAPTAVQEQNSRDAEGYNVPIPADDPISQAERDAVSSEPSASQLKVDIRNAPISEEADADSAMANMASTLRAQAAPPRRTTTNRGRREVRSAVFPTTSGLDSTTTESPAMLQSSTVRSSTPPPAFAMASAPSLASSPLAAVPAFAPQPVQRSSVSEDATASDTQSIISSKSTGANILAARHPPMHAQGLNSSVIETTSVWLEKGSVTRAVVIGEVGLVYNMADPSESPRNGNIRLDNFSSLEKVAPNPAFISDGMDSENPGEYTVDLASLARNASNASTAFKYQVHIPSDRIKHQAPIILVPSWRVEEKQTSVILSYSLNPLFTASVTLTNVTLIIHLATNDSGSGKAITCQSKPAGTFSKEKNLVFWKLEELALNPEMATQKILARFATDGQAKAGKVEAKWEIVGESTVAMGLGSGLEVSHLDSGESSTDPFADEAAPKSWKTLQSSRKVISGAYTAL